MSTLLQSWEVGSRIFSPYSFGVSAGLFLQFALPAPHYKHETEFYCALVYMLTYASDNVDHDPAPERAHGLLETAH